MKKALTVAVAVILLFIGVAFAPSIHANISKEMVEYTTEICGLNGGKQTVKLTQEEAEEVEALFDTIRERLNATETREEAEEIFKEAVVELDKFGLLGGLSVKQAQMLVTGRHQNSKAVESLEKLSGKLRMKNDSNYFCLVAGESNCTGLCNRIETTGLVMFWVGAYLYLLLGYVWEKLYYFFEDLGLEVLIILLIIEPIAIALEISWMLSLTLASIGGYFSYKIPLCIGRIIEVGTSVQDWYSGEWSTTPAQGWIHTIGLNGEKKWNGKLYGQIRNLPIVLLSPGPFTLFKFYAGVAGFTGIKIENPDYEVFYIGSAIRVKVGSEPPY